jgi:hypothetical protein
MEIPGNCLRNLVETMCLSLESSCRFEPIEINGDYASRISETPHLVGPGFQGRFCASKYVVDAFFKGAHRA